MGHDEEDAAVSPARRCPLQSVSLPLSAEMSRRNELTRGAEGITLGMDLTSDLCIDLKTLMMESEFRTWDQCVYLLVDLD